MKTVVINLLPTFTDAIESLSQTVGEQTAHAGLLARENNEHVRNLAIAAAKLEMLSIQYSKLEGKATSYMYCRNSTVKKTSIFF